MTHVRTFYGREDAEKLHKWCTNNLEGGWSISIMEARSIELDNGTTIDFRQNPDAFDITIDLDEDVILFDLRWTGQLVDHEEWYRRAMSRSMANLANALANFAHIIGPRPKQMTSNIGHGGRPEHGLKPWERMQPRKAR